MQPQNQEVIVFLIAANIIVVVVAIFFFFILRVQQKRRQMYQQQLIEKEYKTREEAFLQISRDLHDEVGSSLSGISLFTQIAGQQLKENNLAEAEKNLDKAANYAMQVIEKVSDMAWLLKPSQESVSILTAKLKTYGLALTGAKNIRLHFEVLADNSGKELDIQQRKVIYLISKEAINNAVKYAECRNIYYSMGQGNRILIKDDGKGFTAAEVTEGNGLKNMRARAADIQASIRIHSALGQGTSIELEL